MENKFFLHRIRKDSGAYNKGIEVHDTLNSAIRSFHSQMKMAYNNPSYPNTTYVSCMITNGEDKVIAGYNETWKKENITDFFVHYIRHDGATYTKDIDICDTYDDACRIFHTQLEYGYDNANFPDMTLVAAKITSENGWAHKSEHWIKEE